MTGQDNKTAAITAALDNLPSQPPNPLVTKVIVAVHGIGDQFNYATVQTVTRRFCSFLGLSTGIPLGTFHANTAVRSGARLAYVYSKLTGDGPPTGYGRLGEEAQK